MMSIDEDRLISDLCSVAFLLKDLKNKQKISVLYHDFIILNEMLYFNFGKIIMIEKLYENMERLEKIMLDKSKKNFIQFCKIVDESQDFLIDLSNRFNRRLRTMGAHAYPFFDSLRCYNENDFKDLVLEYYSTFGNDIYKIVNRYFEESRIHEQTKCLEDDYAAFFTGLTGLDSGYIFLLPTKHKYNSLSASNLVHEFGHAVDAERFIFPQKRSISLFQDVLAELPSVSFEIGFNSYLKEKHIDREGSDILINIKTMGLNLYLKEVGLALKKENYYITPDGMSFDDNGIPYELRDGIMYGIGGYFALHLNEVRKQCPEDFMKILNNIITTRNRIDIPGAVKMLGIDEEDFLKGKMINKEIRNNILELKQRYKY